MREPLSPRDDIRIALVGNPNCGKTAIFNLLTGSRQKVANYAGVTVERKEGQLRAPSGRTYTVLDLPGVYSLRPLSADEAVTRDVLLGRHPGERAPDLIVCVVDATRLRLNLKLVLDVLALHAPTLLVLNMVDRARDLGISIDRRGLEKELGIPVVEAVGVARDGANELKDWLFRWPGPSPTQLTSHTPELAATDLESELQRATEQQREVQRIMERVVRQPADTRERDERIDRIVLHPVLGPMILAGVLFLIFQAVFSWASVPIAYSTPWRTRFHVDGGQCSSVKPDTVAR